MKLITWTAGVWATMALIGGVIYILLGLMVMAFPPQVVHAGIPTGTPGPTSTPHPLLVLPTPEPLPTATAEPTATPQAVTAPTPMPDLMPAGDISTGDPEALHEAGPVELTVRACVDLNGDRRCMAGEGIYGLPVAVVNTQMGAVLAVAQTDEAGIAQAHVVLPEQTELSVDVPYLSLSQPFWNGQEGVEIVVPTVQLPKVLP